MSGNRVEELEAKVRELEATINGLTDELVETKERLEIIEEETGIEPDALDEQFGRTPAGEPTADADGDADPVADSEADDERADGDEDGAETADSDGDDIIVA